VHYALGLAGAAAGVKDEQGIFSVHLFRLARFLDIISVHFLCPGKVASRYHGSIIVGPVDHDYFFTIGAGLQCHVGIGFAVDYFAAAIITVGADQ